MALLHAEQGWIPANQQRLLGWLVHAREFHGGKLVKPTIDQIRDDFLETLDEEQWNGWPEMLAQSENGSDEDDSPTASRAFVQHWQRKDFLPELDGLVKAQRSLTSEKFTMSRGSIESTSPSAVCLIPGGLVDALSQDEILDMIAYLVFLSGQDFPGE